MNEVSQIRFLSHLFSQFVARHDGSERASKQLRGATDPASISWDAHGPGSYDPDAAKAKRRDRGPQLRPEDRPSNKTGNVFIM